MALTEGDVYRIEHELIKDQCIWEAVDDASPNWRAALLFEIAGINDMASAIVAAIEADRE